MKLLLALDRRFVPHGDDMLTEGATGPETGARYMPIFDEVVIAGRRGTLDDRSLRRYTKVSQPGISVRLLPNLSGVRAQLNRSQVRRLLKREIAAVDAVIGRLPTELGMEACRVAERQGVPWAVELAGCPYDAMRHYGTWQARLYAPMVQWRTRRVVARAPFISYVTTSFLQRRYPNQRGHTLVCSNVDIEEPSEPVLALRLQRVKAVRRPIIFGTVGSLHGRLKGIQDSLKALGQLREELPDFEYRVLGPGDAKPWQDLAHERGISDRVSFDGSVPSGQPVLDWLDNVDVYLHPSLREGLPRAIIEAMSRGCPVIASSVAGTPELLGREVMHRPGDVVQLKRLIPLSISPAWQETQAKRNWEVAKRYTRGVLEHKRTEFWREFACYAASKAAQVGRVWVK